MNLAPIIAGLRHAGSYGAGIVTALAIVGMKPDDAKALVDAITQTAKGLGDLIAALSVLAPIVLGLLAARKQTAPEQIKSIGNMTVAQATQAVESLPTTAKNEIKIATMPPSAIVNAAAALVGVSKIEVTNDAEPALSAIAENPGQPKVVSQIATKG